MRVYRAGVTAFYLGGSRIQFRCPNGHETVRDYSLGPRAARLTEVMAHRVAMMWDEHIRIPFICRKCPPQRPRASQARSAEPSTS